MRGKQAPKRKIIPDPVYKSEVVTKFVNKIMGSGKKVVARKLLYSALENLSTAVKEEPVSALNKALGNVKPIIEVRTRRVGGANYSIPVQVSLNRQESLAMKWLIAAARAKEGVSFDKKISEELIKAYKGEGDAVKKKSDVEKMAEANRAFAHLGW